MNIAVLTSGGVDSSVALAHLVRQGHRPTAFYLKIWLEDELSWLGQCPWQDDLAYVEKLCKQLDVPLEIVNLQREYHEHIVGYTLEQIKAGATPNPDVMCNAQIKFGVFYQHVGTAFDAIATGHYAQTRMRDGLTQLVMSPDVIKDQTYFLSRLSQDQLRRAMFPIGHLEKAQVRALAHEYDVPAKNRKDSQGICFLGKIKFREFITHHLGTKSGPFIECETGRQVGTHEGAWFYTIGQRQGIGLSGGPWYVTAKDQANNTVFISRAYHAPDKERDLVHATQFHWITGQRPASTALKVKLRHGPAMVPAQITYNGDRGQIVLSERDQGIAPGQFVAFYEDDVCHGSALMSAEGKP